MNVRVEETKEVVGVDLGDVVVSPLGEAFMITNESLSPNNSYMAISLDGTHRRANGCFRHISALWFSLREIGFKHYSKSEFDLVLKRK